MRPAFDPISSSFNGNTVQKNVERALLPVTCCMLQPLKAHYAVFTTARSGHPTRRLNGIAFNGKPQATAFQVVHRIPARTLTPSAVKRRIDLGADPKRRGTTAVSRVPARLMKCWQENRESTERSTKELFRRRS